MHRIRLASQWQLRVADNGGAELRRTFHTPTGLEPNDDVQLTADLQIDFPVDWLDKLQLQINDSLCETIRRSKSGLAFRLTPHLQRFNHLALRLGTASNCEDFISRIPPWPLENIALEIHSKP
jgi:hypothetical protein